MTQTAQTAITPLQRLAKVLQLGTPSTYRSHTYVNGEKPVFPHWPRVRRSGDRAGHDGRIQNGSAISSAEFDSCYFISAGDIRQDLLFDVENLRDGRSFSARRVNVTQLRVRF